jgi:hypothetical protein
LFENIAIIDKIAKRLLRVLWTLAMTVFAVLSLRVAERSEGDEAIFFALILNRRFQDKDQPIYYF